MIFDTDVGAIGSWANGKFALITQAGYKVDLEINNSTFVITPKLYDKNNTLISTGTGVDLPLESVVVNGSYDNTNKKIILTLKSGSTVDIPVGDLISGLYSKPSGGIPKTDLAEAVQTSLGKADTAIQSHQDISGKVNGPSSSVNGRVAIFDGTSGKTIKDSGFTIGKSVPSDAVFTDTTYESKSASSGGTAVSLVTTGEKYTWNNKGSYSKPSGGIPKTDLADAVQTSLGKADTAIQSHQDISGKADKATTLAGYGITDAKIANGVITLGANTITPLTSHQSLAAYVQGPASSVNNRIAIFDGTGGKTIKDSGYTIGKSVPSDAVFTDTTYESKAASSGGTAVSLVTTGEKYTWNNKGSYSKPSGGIPKTDLASAVQTSLGLADTAIQSHQSLAAYVKGPSSSVDARVAVFDGTGGKTIKDSGYTIAKSVPSDAKFTDTTYSAISNSTINSTFV